MEVEGENPTSPSPQINKNTDSKVVLTSVSGVTTERFEKANSSEESPKDFKNAKIPRILAD